MRSAQYLASFLSLAIAGAASAAVISFDPDGPGPAPVAAVGSLDFLPGNILSIAGQDVTGAPNVSLYYQARLGAILDGAGHVIPTPGLNSTYEITAVFGFTTGVTPTSPNSGIIGGLTPPAPNGYFSLYFDTVVNASDLAGTGFRDGTRILSANPTSAFGSIADIPLPSPLDSFNSANYPGVLSDFATGGLKVGATALAVAPAFFPAGSAFNLLADTTLASPYFHTDPSANFDTGPDGLIIATPSLLGTYVNGQAPIGVLESDGAVSLIPVPEPTTLVLLPAAALLVSRRRR